MSKEIIFKKRIKTLEIYINVPENLNAMNLSMYKDISNLLSEADKDDSISSVIITGVGDFFCSGNSISEFLTMANRTNEENESSKNIVREFMLAVVNFSKPIIAAVNGPAIGVGATMLCHCDYIISKPDAYFQTPFTKLGLAPEFGSSLLLPSQVGEKLSKRMLVFSEKLSVDEAVNVGFVSKASEDPLGEARRITSSLASLAPLSMKITSTLLNEKNKHKVIQTIEEELEIFFDLIIAGEAKEAVNAYLQKRKPVY